MHSKKTTIRHCKIRRPHPSRHREPSRGVAPGKRHVAPWDDPVVAAALAKYISPGSEPPVPRCIDDIPHLINYSVKRQIMSIAQHSGQRKLVLGKIRFLSLYAGQDAASVVYAGAAPSTTIGILHALFPNVRWLLVDPAPFVLYSAEGRRELDSSLVTKLKHVEDWASATTPISILNCNFTTSIAEKLSGQCDYFWSDVRTANSLKNDPGLADILWNSAQQYIWTKIIDAKISMLKFRAFYGEKCPVSKQMMHDFITAAKMGLDLRQYLEEPPSTFKYFAGEMWIQPWASYTSTETRLIVHRGAGLTDYNSAEYEGKMHFHNMVIRNIVGFRVNPRCKALCQRDIYDDCADCAQEKLILSEYYGPIPQDNIPLMLNTVTVPIMGRRGQPHGFVWCCGDSEPGDPGTETRGGQRQGAPCIESADTPALIADAPAVQYITPSKYNSAVWQILSAG